jgi:hypothetical protein
VVPPDTPPELPLPDELLPEELLPDDLRPEPLDEPDLPDEPEPLDEPELSDEPEPFEEPELLSFEPERDWPEPEFFFESLPEPPLPLPSEPDVLDGRVELVVDQSSIAEG